MLIIDTVIFSMVKSQFIMDFRIFSPFKYMRFILRVNIFNICLRLHFNEHDCSRFSVTCFLDGSVNIETSVLHFDTSVLCPITLRTKLFASYAEIELLE